MSLPKELFDDEGNYQGFNALQEILAKVSETYRTLRASKLLWRGQVNNWPLVPKVYRGYREHDEHDFALNFCLGAPTRISSWPNRRAEQLFLMQHYGLPTRLLDWSRSLFTAMYFSVKYNLEHEGRDGALYALHPGLLNSCQVGEDRTLTPDTQPVITLIDEAFTRCSERDSASTANTLAINGPQVDKRMFVQSSAFTIHSDKTPLQDLDHNSKFVHVIDIPASQKGKLRTVLDICGIHEAGLFPDLEALARGLIEWKRSGE